MNRRRLSRVVAILGWTLVAAVSRVPAATFESLGPEGGRIDGLAQAPSMPDRVYCLAYRQGVYRSADRGVTWQRVDTGLPVDLTLRGVAVQPTNADVVLVGDAAADRFLRSTDAGVTWTPAPVAAAWDTVSVIAFDPHDASVVLAAISDGPQRGVYRSSDAGMTWSAWGSGMSPPDARGLAFDPGTPGVVLGTNSGGITRSTDGGATWAQVQAGYGACVSYCAGTPTRVWAVAYDSVLRSDNGGLSFTSVTQPTHSESESFDAVAADPVDPDRALVGEVTWDCRGECYASILAVLRTANGGGSWNEAAYDPQPQWNANEHFATLAFDMDQSTRAWIAVTSAGSVKNGLLRTTDSGASFSPSVSGIHGHYLFSVDRDDDGVVYARRRGKFGLWRAPSAGGAWEERAASPVWSLTDCETNHSTPGVLLEAGYYASSDNADPQWARSTDGGQTWAFGFPPPYTYASASLLIRSNQGDASVIYLWTQESSEWRLSRSVDGVFFASTVTTFPTAGAVIDPTDDLRIVAADRATGEVKLTTDGGSSWTTRASGLPTSEPLDVFLDPGDPERLAVVYRTSGAFRSDDGGLAWTPAPVTLGASPVVAADWDPALDRFVIATQSDGLFVTGMGLVSEGLPTLELTGTVFEPVSGKVLIATKHASLLGLDAPDPTDAPAPVAVPALVDLRVQPNPSRKTATVRLSAPPGRHVEVAVFSVDGRRVAALGSGVMSGGTLQFVWDGRDARGDDAAPGVYFVRANVGDARAVRRLVRLDR